MLNVRAVAGMLVAASFGCGGAGSKRPEPITLSATACTPLTSAPDSSGGQIGAFAPGPDGYLAWTDRAAGNHAIVKLDDSLTLIGREGSGPGEFRMIADLGWRGDTVWTSDLRLQRVQLFSAQGTLIRSASPPARATFAWVGGDTLVGFPLQSIAESLLTILRYVPGDSELDTLAALRHPLVAPLEIEAQGSRLMGPQPLAERAMGARSPDGSRWCGAEPGREASVRLACVAPDGRVLLDTTVTILPEPLGDNDVADVLDGFAEIPGLSREKVAAALYVPAHRARVSRMLLEDDGAIWLQRTSSRDSMAVWERWSADGVREATLLITSRQRPLLFRRDTLYVAAADEDDLQHVERCRLD